MKNDKPSPLDVVVLYSTGHLGSAIILNKLLKMPAYRVVGIVKANTFCFSTKGLKKAKKQFFRLGWRFSFLLAWQRLWQIIAFVLSSWLPFCKKRLLSSGEISSSRHIEIHECSDINSLESHEFISRLEADLLISAYFPQILKKETIELPKKGVLNVHPGWLPTYKGAMAYFHVLKEQEKLAGVSVHWMDEGIDTGKLISRRKFRLEKGMTQVTVLVLGAFITAHMLNKIGLSINQKKTLKAECIGKDEQAAYYRMPDEQDFEKYFKKRRFFRISEIFAVVSSKNSAL